MHRGLAIIAMTLAPGIAFAEESLSAGQLEFVSRCAVCHGVEANGNGPMAKYLTLKVPDLTQLSRQNDGAFPYERVIRVIDGRAIVAAHGPREMPVWGDAFVKGFGDHYGFVGSLRSEVYVAGRIYSLVTYLEGVQSD